LPPCVPGGWGVGGGGATRARAPVVSLFVVGGFGGGAPPMSYGTFTVSLAPGLGRQPPEKVPSWRQEPVKVASSGACATVMVTLSLRTSHRYGNGDGEKPEYTVDGKVSVCGS